MEFINGFLRGANESLTEHDRFHHMRCVNESHDECYGVVSGAFPVGVSQTSSYILIGLMTINQQVFMVHCHDLATIRLLQRLCIGLEPGRAKVTRVEFIKVYDVEWGDFIRSKAQKSFSVKQLSK
ncbi:TPA: hypothetical protein DF272_04485 [Candidatus Falkowbacteria bacterium]|nr:hypothetical protein [Candidatus Falkowbacteria bacterium]